MHATTRRLPTIFAFLSITLAWGSLASAQEPAKGTPFDKGVRISVLASKPARIKGGDWDDKMQKILLTVKFENKDMRQAYEGYSATVSVLGQSTVDRKLKKVLGQDQVDLTLAPNQTVEHVCDPVTTRFDKNGLKFGFFYDGWIIVVKDKQGKIVQVRATSESMAKFTELAAKIQVGKCYDAQLKLVDRDDE